MTHTVCIVGAGIGAQHLEGYAALPDRFRVKAICDLNAERAGALAARLPGTGVLTSYEAALADPEIDIIDICLPSSLHFRPALQALQAGKAVVVEKPIAASLYEADLLAESVARTGRPVFPVFQYRYGIGTAQLRALRDAGLTGKPYAGTLETHWNRGPDYYAAASWRGTWGGEMGGILITHAIHIHDYLPAFLGPVAQVYADLGTRVNPVEVEDCAALAIRMESGALVTSSVTLGAAQDTSRMRLMFEGLTVESDHAPYAPAAKPWTFTARAPRAQAEIDAVLAGVSAPLPGYAGMFDAMADALEGRPGAEVTLADGRRSLEFATACYHSARTGAPVALPLTPDHPLYAGWLP